MSGTLYLVATPIGNLGDLSPRGVQTLQEADFIAAEDTRVSMKLLNHFVRSAMYRRLGEPLPHLLANTTQVHLVVEQLPLSNK